MLSRVGLNFIFALALVIRLALIPHPGFKADIAYWKWWGKVAAEEGATSAYKHTNYPPVYIYVLQATSIVYNLFSPLDGNYWMDTDFLYLLLVKLPYIAADLGIGFLIYKILSKFPSSNKIPILGSALFLLNPAVIYNSAIWGQTDSLSAFFILLMYYALFKSQYLMFAILIALNVFLKVQSLPFVILALVILIKKLDISRVARLLIPAVIAAFIINLPHIVKNNYAAPISVMVNSIGYFPYASLNAYNLHWLLIKGASDSYPDKSLIGGFVSHKILGTTIFASLFLMFIYYLWTNTERSESISQKEKTTLFQISLLTIFASFLFMTEIHERYFFPIYLFGTLLTPLSLAQKGLIIPFFKQLTQSVTNKPFKQRGGSVTDEYVDSAEGKSYGIKKMSATIGAEKSGVENLPIWVYVILTISGLINLHLVMIQNYPENNLSFLKFMEIYRIHISLVLSVINILLFGYLFLKFIKFSPRNLGFLLPIIAIIILGITTKLFNFSTQTPLTSIKPAYYNQSWGELKINKSVGGNLLSPAYYFHRKGLGTHSNSKIVYRLGGKYSKFKTGFGQDIESPDGAHTQFAIMLDDKIVFQSELFDKWTKPGFVEIPVSGVDNLALFVLDGGDGVNGDHADWLEPMLYK